MATTKQVGEALQTLSKEQALRFLEITFNEKGLIRMADYFTIGSIDVEDKDTRKECSEYMRIIRMAKKLK
jgi:hypothetical protein